MTELSQKRCIPCEGGDPALTPEQAKDLMEQVPLWTLSDDSKKLSREFKFNDFAQALAFTNKVGAIAEEQWHHPDIVLGWGKVKVSLTTHAAHGLSENDFIVAAHIDLLQN
jgi:4a-hydroxytetrahydrobiopterin dehydratase